MVKQSRHRRFAGGVISRLPFGFARRAASSSSPSASGIAAPRALPLAIERLEGRTLLAADFVISEFMASNDKTLADKFGTYSDWIEVHNRGTTAGDLSGYYLTDDGNNLTQWRFPSTPVPANGYVLVFASSKDLAVAGQELHTNFQLSDGGEYLALVNPDGVTVQHAYAPAYPSQSKDISYGLTNENDVASGLQYLTQPTPGRANVANAPEPVFSVDSRTFATNFALTLSLPAGAPAGAEIRYTLNNAAPTATSTKYTAPINISTSTVVRAIVTAPGRTPSPVVSRNYLALDASVQSFNSNLPVVVVDSFGSGFGDTALTPVSAYFIDTAASDGRAEMLDAPDFAGRGGMRLRGQSSQGFAKQPYAFETWDEANGDKSVSILGMPKESDWVLYNPYSEKSLMQNALAYMWANRMGDYAVRTRFVELFVNQAAGGKVDYSGDYRGIYLFMEKIKIDDDRVDIEKLTPQDNAQPDITGGYIWAKDKFDAGEVGFSAGGQQWTFKDPSENEITPAQKAYLTGYINEFASVLNGANYKDPVNGYAKYIDVDSWIDHHIMVEMTKNIDGFRISTYYYKDRNGKIVSGPIWDYNLSLGNADYLTGQTPTGWYHDQLGDSDYPYWRRLFSDPAFAQRYQDRWQQLRKNELSNQRLMADIDGLVQLLSDGNGNYPVGTVPTQVSNNALVRNFKRWNVLGQYVWPNGHVDSQGRWIEEVNWMKDWLLKRVQWWDSQYVAMPTIAPNGGPVSDPTQVSITSTGGVTLTDTPLLVSGATAKALVPTADIGSAWRNLSGFDDSSWLSGTTGIGYDDDTAGGGNYVPLLGLNLTAPPNGQTPAPMRNAYGSVYARVPFNLPAGTDPATIQSLILKMRYDDGFVAYLNGTEIARSSNGIPADPTWDASGGGSHDAAGFEEFDVTQFRNLLQPGANLLAIQGINTTLGSSDLLLLPELVARSSTATPAPVYYTTDGSDPRLPAGGISPTAQLYTGPFTVNGTTRVRARSFLNNKWSGLADELYDFGENRLRVTELMYNPAPPLPTSTYLPAEFEYVELQNTGTAPMNLAGYRFDKGIDFTFGARTLGPGERVLVVHNQAAFESRYGTDLTPLIAGTFTGSLSDGGERVRLLGRVGETIQDFNYSDDWYKQTDGTGYSLTIVDPAAALTAWSTKEGWRASEPLGGTPGAGDSGLRPNSVVINEVLSNPQQADNFGDFIELRNTTASAIDIGGWWLSDTAGDLKKWQIPAGTTVPANGYKVFTQIQDFGAAFGLSPSGEGVFLSSGDASGAIGGYRVDETFGASDVGVTFGRYVKSTGGADFTTLASATRGAANAAPLVGPVVINEIMYSPAEGKSEFVELRNLTGADVPLYLAGSPAVTWRLSGGVDFALPGGATIPANGYAIIAAVDAGTFRQQYPNTPATVPIWGPYTLPSGVNVLSDSGETLRLQRPQVTTATPRPYIDVDTVAYDDDLPWPADTKGTGQSLGRLNGAAYGNDPANWDSERLFGSPGAANFAADFVPPTVDVINITPDPRTTAVDTVNVVFSERVTGFDLGDVRLTRDGTPVDLFADTITLTTSDGGGTWTLRGLSARTLATGNYALTVVAAGSGIRDAAGNALAVDGADAWRMNNPDTGLPTVNIVDVPEPRKTPVNTISIVFSEVVTGFDLSDLTLTRNGGANLLTASNTLVTTDGGKTYTLGGLTAVTTPEGHYVLTLRDTGTGIVDLAGNALPGGATDDWFVDTSTPTVDIVDVTPDPRKDSIDTVTIRFSEPVTGFDLADLKLRRDGGGDLLVSGQTLTTADNGKTWVLHGLGGVSGVEGFYELVLSSEGTGIVDAGFNALATGATATWTVDTTAPTASVDPVSPDPRPGAVSSINIFFSEPVTGLDPSDFQLTRRSADGSVTNVLDGRQTLVTDGVLWVLGNLAGVTGGAGTYTLTLVSGVSGVTDVAGNSLGSDVTDSWVVTPQASVAGRYVFYNNSAFDRPAAGLAAAAGDDDRAIAPDKQPLLPGQTGGYSNYTSYGLGINGIMIDVAGLPALGNATLSAADFVFRAGTGSDPSAWAVAPAPSSVSVRRGAGAGGSDRVVITFADGAVRNQWLQVTMSASAATGLARPDVFYFGNLTGEVGDAAGSAVVGARDLVLTRSYMTQRNLPASNRFDHNRDGRVDSRDLALVKANLNRRLPFLGAPAPAAVFGTTAIASVDAPLASASTAAATQRMWSEAPADLLDRNS